MMRVLFLSPSPPWPQDAGGRIRTYHLLRALSKSCEIDLWTVRQPEFSDADIPALQSVTRDLRLFERTRARPLRRLTGPKQETWFHSAAMVRALQDLRTPDYDLIHVDELCLARALPDPLPCPAVMHHHKLDLELARAVMPAGPQQTIETRRWHLLEQHGLSFSTGHVFCCAEDAARFEARHPTVRSWVVESGVDIEEFAPRARERDDDHLLVLGSLDYEPNARGLEEFLSSPWSSLRNRHPNLRLSVVGRSPERNRWSSLPAGVTLVGAVDDVRPWLARATALVVPLSIGGGTRLKIVEAAAMGCPIASTSTGFEGLAFEADQHLTAAPNVRELGTAVTQLLSDPAGRATSAQRARELVEQRYGWNTLAERLLRAWNANRRRALPKPVGDSSLLTVDSRTSS